MAPCEVCKMCVWVCGEVFVLMVCVCRTVALRATAARVRAHTTCIHIRGAYAQALMGASFSARTQPASGCRRGAVSIACASWLPEVVEAASDSTDMASS